MTGQCIGHAACGQSPYPYNHLRCRGDACRAVHARRHAEARDRATLLAAAKALAAAFPAPVRAGNWRHSAACAQSDPDAWFPEKGGGGQAQDAEAKRVCARCPVTAECLADAMAGRELEGIWGGLTADERKALARRNRQEAS